MMREVLSRFDLPMLPIIGLFIFLTLFIGVIIYTFCGSNKEKFESLERLPFQEGTKV
jgi:cbb3-type cytochrome oxidase subunit 3